jgi:hypothetical protein
VPFQVGDRRNWPWSIHMAVYMVTGKHPLSQVGPSLISVGSPTPFIPLPSDSPLSRSYCTRSRHCLLITGSSYMLCMSCAILHCINPIVFYSWALHMHAQRYRLSHVFTIPHFELIQACFPDPPKLTTPAWHARLMASVILLIFWPSGASGILFLRWLRSNFCLTAVPE